MGKTDKHILKEMPQYHALWKTIVRHKKSVYKIVGTVTVLMLVYVLIMPQSFTSTATLMPPQQEKSNMGLASLLSGGSMPLMDLTSTFGFGSRPADLYVQILKSRTIAESLIVREKLDVFFDIAEDLNYRHAIEPLQEASEFEATKDGIINISVTLQTGFFAGEHEIDSIKQQAAYLANRYVYWLDRINREKMISKARQSRMFIEAEIKRTQAELDSAFGQLVEFQKANKSVYLEKQTETAMTGAAVLRDKLYQAEIALREKKQDFAESSRIIEQLESQTEQLRKLYAELSTSGKSTDSDFFVPFEKLPEVARELTEHMRDVKVLEQVILFLNQQYYQDRVQEAKDTPTTQVLDVAVPAIKRTSPKRALWMVLTVLFSTFISILYVALRYGPPRQAPSPSSSSNADSSSDSTE